VCARIRSKAVFNTFALAKIWGGMTLSGPKACLGSTKDARTYRRTLDLRFDSVQSTYFACFLAFTGHGGREGIVDTKGHFLRDSSAVDDS